MRVQKQTHWLAKFIAFVMSFVVIGASDALAETAMYQADVNNHVQVSMLDYQMELPSNRMQGVEFYMPSGGVDEWRLGVDVSDRQYVSSELETNLNVVLYFKRNL